MFSAFFASIRHRLMIFAFGNFMASTMRTDNLAIPSLLFQVKTGGFFIWKLLKEIVDADYLHDVYLLVYPKNSIISWVVKYFLAS